MYVCTCKERNLAAISKMLCLSLHGEIQLKPASHTGVKPWDIPPPPRIFTIKIYINEISYVIHLQ